jgi:hypothetical protein
VVLFHRVRLCDSFIWREARSSRVSRDLEKILSRFLDFELAVAAFFGSDFLVTFRRIEVRDVFAYLAAAGLIDLCFLGLVCSLEILSLFRNLGLGFVCHQNVCGTLLDGLSCQIDEHRGFLIADPLHAFGLYQHFFA